MSSPKITRMFGLSCARRVTAQRRTSAATRAPAFTRFVIGRLSSRLGSVHQLEVARLPRAVERRRLRPVDAEVREPALAGDRLDPLSLVARGRLGTEIQVHGRALAVLQLEDRAQRGVALVGGDLRASVRVVDRDGPEE